MIGLRETVRADLDALLRSQELYNDASSSPQVWKTLLTNIGFQQLAVYRLASWCAGHRLVPIAMVIGRLMRHLYDADMHYASDIEPGVVVVHGNGLVISRTSSVGAGCILSQQVTLGVSRIRGRPDGSPRLDHDVHVGPGAVLVGPITVGAHTKVAPNVFVSGDVEPWTVITPAPANHSPSRDRPAEVGTLGRSG